MPLRVALPPSPPKVARDVVLDDLAELLHLRHQPTEVVDGADLEVAVRRAAEVLELDVLAVELPAERFQLSIEEPCPYVLEGDLQRVEVVVRGDVGGTGPELERLQDAALDRVVVRGIRDPRHRAVLEPCLGRRRRAHLEAHGALHELVGRLVPA